MDSASGKVIDKVSIGEGVDANAFDPQTELAFASCRGVTTIAHEESADKLKMVQTLETAPGARTMGLDLQTHKIYLPTAQTEHRRPVRRGRGSFLTLSKFWCMGWNALPRSKR